LKKVYLAATVIILLMSLSNIGYTQGDLKIKVRDSLTGNTVYEYEKTYTPKEQEAMKQQQKEIQVKQLQIRASGKDVEFEKRKLQERLKRINLEMEKEQHNVPDLNNKDKTEYHERKIETYSEQIKDTEEQIRILERDPEYHFYLKNEAIIYKRPPQNNLTGWGRIEDPHTGELREGRLR
jgi:preprotein translocase subunit SecF